MLKRSCRLCGGFFFCLRTTVLTAAGRLENSHKHAALDGSCKPLATSYNPGYNKIIHKRRVRI